METDAHPATGLSAFVAKEIRIMLVRLDLKQSELAARLGVNEMWLSRRLRGAQPIDLNDLQRIAETLGVEVTDLLPRPSEGRTVVTAGDSGRTTAYAMGGAPSNAKPNVRKATLTGRTRPIGSPTHQIPRQATRRPARLDLAHAGS